VISLLIAATIAFFVAILGTPPLIRYLRKREVGQFIHWDVQGHTHKRGTPTMGGIVIIAAAVVGYFGSQVRLWTPDDGFGLSVREWQTSGVLVLIALVGMGLIGFIDDLTKHRNARNAGLSMRWKFAGQLAIAALFAWAAVAAGVSTELSFTRGLGVDLGPFYVLWVLLMMTAAANAVNLTDGLDGLAAGSASLVYGAFVIIGFWQLRQIPRDFYDVEEPLGLAVVAAALLGATLGFLWWNAAPAQIFMGDVGSNALGGAMAALALLTNTQLLLVVLGGLYVLEAGSVILQVFSFRVFGRRIFTTTPIHHHFERIGWPETTIIVRFWILAGISVGLGLGIFYGDFITSVDL
jgi:phospho-N-acetylmuramoyl-pentapeptide-transferase